MRPMIPAPPCFVPQFTSKVSSRAVPCPAPRLACFLPGLLITLWVDGATLPRLALAPLAYGETMRPMLLLVILGAFIALPVNHALAQ